MQAEFEKDHSPLKLTKKETPKKVIVEKLLWHDPQNAEEFHPFQIKIELSHKKDPVKVKEYDTADKILEGKKPDKEEGSPLRCEDNFDKEFSPLKRWLRQQKQ